MDRNFAGVRVLVPTDALDFLAVRSYSFGVRCPSHTVHDKTRSIDMNADGKMKSTLFSNRHRFADWPNTEVPAVAAGVYVVWDGNKLKYSGMSGRQIEKTLGA